MSKGPVKDPYIGTVIDGRYRVTSRVARGGMATVYRAIDERLDREMAIKIMHPHLADGPAGEAFLTRFQREARSAARLSHPHVVGVYDQGADGEVSYLAMELIEGDNLRSWLSRAGSLTVADTFDITEAVLLALSAADKQGLIHRDIKPENVLITNDGVVKVADFGLARAASEVSTTTTGTILGTVAYVAPEVISEGVVDQRTDLYATGIMAYEILTGEQPFVGQTPIQIAFQHVNSEVPRPSSKLNWLPSEVDDFIATLTARDPADRPSNATEALSLLRRCRSELTADILARRKEPEPGDATGTDATALAGANSPEFPQLRPAGTDAIALEARGYSQSRVSPQEGHQQANATQALGQPNAGQTMAFEVPEVSARRDTSDLAATAEEGDDSLQPQWLGAPKSESHMQHSGTLVAANGRPPARRARKEPKRRGGKRRASRIVLPIIVVLILAGGAVGLWWWNTHGPGSFADIPESIQGMSQQELEGRLDALGLVVTDPALDYHDQVREGAVITTDPEPGSRVKRGSEVTIVVSRGIRMLDLPGEGIIDESIDSATALLDDIGFNAPGVEREYDDEIPAGTVMSMTPEGGESYPHNTTITLVVSDGPAPVTIPDVEGETQSDAEATLEDNGLRVAIEEQSSEEIEEGRVISQSPDAGSDGKRTDTVTIIVSTGLPFIEVPSIPQRANYDEWETRLEDLGFEVRRQNQFGGFFNAIVGQSLNPGEMVRKGTTITLTVI